MRKYRIDLNQNINNIFDVVDVIKSHIPNIYICSQAITGKRCYFRITSILKFSTVYKNHEGMVCGGHYLDYPDHQNTFYLPINDIMSGRRRFIVDEKI